MTLPSTTVTIWGLGLIALVMLTLILVIVLFAMNTRLRKQLRHWQEIHSTADLEEVYQRTLRRVEQTDATLEQLGAQLQNVESTLRTKVSTPRVTRYNAFADTGSDLSFSVALVDDTQTGVVLSSIYGREESRTYGKPVANGESTYPLTDEESQVLAPGPLSKQRSHARV